MKAALQYGRSYGFNCALESRAGCFEPSKRSHNWAGPRLRVFVQGKPWTLNPAIQEQLFLIGREPRVLNRKLTMNLNVQGAMRNSAWTKAQRQRRKMAVTSLAVAPNNSVRCMLSFDGAYRKDTTRSVTRHARQLN